MEPTTEVNGHEVKVHSNIHFREYHEISEDSTETDYIVATERGSSNMPRAVTEELHKKVLKEFGFDLRDEDIRVVGA